MNEEVTIRIGRNPSTPVEGRQFYVVKCIPNGDPRVIPPDKFYLNNDGVWRLHCWNGGADPVHGYYTLAEAKHMLEAENKKNPK